MLGAGRFKVGSSSHTAFILPQPFRFHKSAEPTPLECHIFQTTKSEARMLRHASKTRRYIAMAAKPPKDPLLVVLGATGTGKSQV
jgi:hypothetical protein